jgi:hypothetical protein
LQLCNQIRPLEKIDYYTFFETKSAFLTKYRIRMWIGLTRLDLIGDKLVLKEIFSEFRTSIQLKIEN